MHTLEWLLLIAVVALLVAPFATLRLLAHLQHKKPGSQNLQEPRATPRTDNNRAWDRED